MLAVRGMHRGMIPILLVSHGRSANHPDGIKVMSGPIVPGGMVYLAVKKVTT